MRSLWGPVGKSEMKSTHQAAQNPGAGPATIEDVLAAASASSFKERMGKMVREIKKLRGKFFMYLASTWPVS